MILTISTAGDGHGQFLGQVRNADELVVSTTSWAYPTPRQAYEAAQRLRSRLIEIINTPDEGEEPIDHEAVRRDHAYDLRKHD